MKYTLSALIFFLVLISCKNNTQTDPGIAKQTDTSIHQPPVAPNIKALIDTLNRGNLGDTDTALAMKLVKEMLVQYPVSRDSFSHFIVMQQLVRNYNIRNENDSVIKYAEECAAFFEHQPYFTKWPVIYHYRLAIANYYIRQYPTAIWHATKARLQMQQPQLRNYIPANILVLYLMDLSRISRASMYIEDAITNATAAQKLSEELKKDEMDVRDDVLLEKADIFLENGQPDSATSYINKVQRSTVALQHPDIQKKLLNTLGVYYTALEKWDSAINATEHYITQTKDGGEKPDVLSYKNLGIAYLNEGKPENAGKNFNQCLKLFAANPKKYDLRDSNYVYNGLLEYYITIGNNKAAHDAFNKYTNLELRYVNERHITEIKEMEAKYKLKEREADIAHLNATVLDGRLAIRQKNQLLLGGLGVLLITLLAALWTYSLQRQKRLRAEKEKLQQQIGKVQLEQRLLRTQMEPHFIFNSLAVLQSYIREGDEDKSIRYISTFARLLRQSLEHSREPLLPLNKELDALENYLRLQQMRFEDLFDYIIHCPKEILHDEDIRIPPMLLQPFVENTIQHGFQGIDYKGSIDITIIAKDRTLQITIADNGKGLNSSNDAATTDHQSLSTRITRERLGMLSADTGVQSDLQITTNGSQGTLIKMIVPVM